MAIREQNPSRMREDRNDTRIALAEVTTRLDSINSDYHDLRSAVAGLGKRIDDLGSSINTKIDQRSQPQWQTYIAGAMLLSGLFFAFISPIQQKQSDDERDIRAAIEKHDVFVRDITSEFTHRNELFVSQDEHKEYKLRIDNTLNYLREHLNQTDTHLDQRFDHIEQMMLGYVHK